jgi:hypothetical protein
MAKLDVSGLGDLQYEELLGILKTEKRCKLVYDIETGPASHNQVRKFFDKDKVDLPKDPGVFDPHAIKYGNLGPAKRKEKLEAKLAEHTKAAASYRYDCKVAIEEAWEKFYSNAALSALTGRVVAIGYGLLRADRIQHFLDIDLDGNDERGIIERHWDLVRWIRRRPGKLISFNGHKFDYPFLRRRSWAYEDLQPLALVTKYRTMEEFCIDVFEEYKRGAQWNDFISLDNLSLMMNLPGKLPDVTGDQFHSLVRTDVATARKYLREDISATARVAYRMDLV